MKRIHGDWGVSAIDFQTSAVGRRVDRSVNGGNDQLPRGSMWYGLLYGTPEQDRKVPLAKKTGK